MLNYETILSNFDDKVTLMQWLKKVEEALQDASATGFEVLQTSETTAKFKLTFADGSTLESEEMTLPRGLQGEQGPRGPQGPQGPKGPAGTGGTKFYKHTICVADYTSEGGPKLNFYLINKVAKSYNLGEFLGQFEYGLQEEGAQYLYFYVDGGMISSTGPFLTFMTDNTNSAVKLFYITPAGAIATETLTINQSVFDDSVTELL